MVRIRFARFGTRNAPVHRIVAIDKRKSRDGEPLEILGTINPRAVEKVVVLHPERIEYWRSQGAEVSLAVHKVLAKHGIMDAPFIPIQTKKSLPKKKAQERMAKAA